MVYVDALAVMLLSLGLSSLLIALYFLGRGLNKKWVSELTVPAFALGFFNFASGFLMSVTWPLPGAYNMLFGDPLLMLGIVMMAGAYMAWKNINLNILSIFGFFIGIYIAVGALAMVNFGLESGVHFLPSFGLYVFAALSGIFSPLMYAKAKGAGKYGYLLLFVLLLITAFLAFLIGYTGLYGHLQSPP
jgi:putative membrane protein